MGLAACLALGLSEAKAAVQFSAGLEIRSAADFREPLMPYGGWVTVGRYGTCWRPTGVEVGWRPYCNGQWVWTDAGWYWESDEPWSWACYHYGYWVSDPYYGWIWVPGTEWAPAWVVWRESPDYIGWAPCGPGGAVVSASFFVFVDVHRFHEHHRFRELIVNDPSIIRQTTVVSGFKRETRTIGGQRQVVVVNQGPNIARIQTRSGTRFTQQPIEQVAPRASAKAPEQLRSRLATPAPRESEQPVRPRTERQDRRREESPKGTAPQNSQRFQTNPRATPETPQPTTPPERALPPTGREPRFERPPTSVPPATPPERSLPPTGRERRVEPPATHGPPAPPPGWEHRDEPRHDKDKDHP